MKHLMTFDIVDHVDGSFDTELEGWEHAQAVANGRAVRLVQSRQVDQDQTELKDLRDSAYEIEPQNGEGAVVGAVIVIFTFAIGCAVGWIVGGMR